MLETGVIIALVMFFAGVVRKGASKVVSEDTVKQVVSPIAVLVLGVTFNVLNAYVFGGDLQAAGKEGLLLAVEAAGLYGIGKSILGRS